MVSSNGSAYKHKVLIVDDEALNIEFLQTLLSEEINVIFATSGEDALTIVKANRPDMILLDIMMPGMDGYEVCKRLKGNEETKDIPVIFVTAKDGPEEEARGLELGAIDYIIKPFNPEIVKSKVRNNIIRIAKPRPDLEEHHTRDRRAPRGERRDRRAADKTGKWKWLAIGVGVAVLALGVLSIVPADRLSVDGLLALVGQGASSSGSSDASGNAGSSTATNQPATKAPATSSTTTPAASVSQVQKSPTSARNRSASLDLKWVKDSACPVIPEVEWWSFNSHISIVRYVERNLDGDWETYTDKWLGRLLGVQDIFERNSTAITNTGVELSGDELADYIEQMEVRVEAIRCLKAEAESHRSK
jgi:CheY-like chemotaxis protein